MGSERNLYVRHYATLAVDPAYTGYTLSSKYKHALTRVCTYVSARVRVCVWAHVWTREHVHTILNIRMHLPECACGRACARVRECVEARMDHFS